MKIHPEAIIEVRLKTAAEGGRKAAISGTIYSCPLIVRGEAFDCRIEIDNPPLELGRTYVLPVQFLFPKLALPTLESGIPIALWEGREIATGRVKEILGRST